MGIHLKVFVKTLIVAPVFVAQSQIYCPRETWHKEGRAHSMESANGHGHTCTHALTHMSTDPHRWDVVEWLLFV